MIQAMKILQLPALDLEARILSTVRSGALYPMVDRWSGDRWAPGSALAAWEQFDAVRRPDPRAAQARSRASSDAGSLFPLSTD